MKTIPENKALVLFDGVCNLCNASVQFIIKHDHADYFRFASLQSELGQEIVAKFGIKSNSIVLIQNDRSYLESHAAFRIATYLKGGYRIFSLGRFLPKRFTDWIYSIIAKNRYAWFGRKQECWIPTSAMANKFLG